MSRTYRNPSHSFYNRSEIMSDQNYYRRKAKDPRKSKRHGWGNQQILMFESFKNYNGCVMGATEGKLIGYPEYNNKDKHIAKRMARRQQKLMTKKLVDQHYIDLQEDEWDDYIEETDLAFDDWWDDEPMEDPWKDWDNWVNWDNWDTHTRYDFLPDPDPFWPTSSLIKVGTLGDILKDEFKKL